MNFVKRIVVLSFFITFVYFSGCVMDPERTWNSSHESLIDDAREYFETNAAEFNLPRQLFPADGGSAATRGGHDHGSTHSSGLPDIILAPQWDKASAYQVGEMMLVDIPVDVNSDILIRRHDASLGKNMQLYRSPTESRLVYMMCDDGEVHLFLATMVADLSGFYKPATNMLHLHPGNDFSGLVFFSELDGDHGQIWEYRKGRACRRMYAQTSDYRMYGILPEDVGNTSGDYIVLNSSLHLPQSFTRSDNSEGFYGKPDPGCLDCQMLGGFACQKHSKTGQAKEVVVVAEPMCEKCLQDLDKCMCPDPIEYRCYYCGKFGCDGKCREGELPPDDTTGEGGVGDGQGNPGTSGDLPEHRPLMPEIDCAYGNMGIHKQQTNAMIQNLFGLEAMVGNGVSYPGFTAFLEAVAGNPGNEHSLALTYDGGHYFSLETEILHGSPNSVKIRYLSNSVADIHNHPSSNPPSASDVWGAMKVTTNSNIYQGRYILGNDGVFYCVAITDRDLARNFVRNNNESDIVGGDNMFKEDTDYYRDFSNALTHFGSFGEQNAWCYALSYLSEKYGMGITLMRTGSNSTSFSTLHVKLDHNNNYILWYFFRVYSPTARKAVM